MCMGAPATLWLLVPPSSPSGLEAPQEGGDVHPHSPASSGPGLMTSGLD